MSKIKNAKEWIKQLKAANPNGIKTEEHIENSIRQIQKQAIEATAELIARKARITTSVSQDGHHCAFVDKAHILSLISSNDLKVE